MPGRRALAGERAAPSGSRACQSRSLSAPAIPNQPEPLPVACVSPRHSLERGRDIRNARQSVIESALVAALASIFN